MSYLPLSFLRGLGSIVGIIMLKFSGRSGKRLRANLLLTGMCSEENVDRFALDTAKELGKTLVEIVTVAWYRSPKQCSEIVAQGANFDQMLSAAKSGAVIFLTPHVGNFEIGVKATSAVVKDKVFNVLYKPNKDPVFDAIMLDGRTEENIKPVPTTRHGVAHLIRTLKNGGLVGILPDSVASRGDGVWVDFFGKKVFATTLAAKLILFPKVTTFFANCVRVKDGFVIDYLPYVPETTDIAVIVQDLYKMIESIILKAPTQYYWSYDRFRKPSHAPDIDFAAD